MARSIKAECDFSEAEANLVLVSEFLSRRHALTRRRKRPTPAFFVRPLIPCPLPLTHSLTHSPTRSPINHALPHAHPHLVLPSLPLPLTILLDTPSFHLDPFYCLCPLNSQPSHPHFLISASYIPSSCNSHILSSSRALGSPSPRPHPKAISSSPLPHCIIHQRHLSSRLYLALLQSPASLPSQFISILLAADRLVLSDPDSLR